MISLKKYLDMDPSQPESNQPASEDPKSDAKSDPKSNLKSDLAAAVLECYRSALRAMGKSGVRACPAVGSDLQQDLAGCGSRLSGNITTALVKETEAHVEERLLQWGESTAKHFKTKANEVKELLLVLAGTAKSMGERDQRYTQQFNKFTEQLEAIADLEDLSQIRASLVERATELKTCVDRMAEDSKRSVAQLQAEVSTYETKLKAVEQVALRDGLTGLANRRNVEEHIEWRIAHLAVFSVAILDLERFKQVNDSYGHPVGDNLLQQFAQELQSNSRATDIVGRWGGDEFILILDCDLSAAKLQLQRLQKWAFGEYTINLAALSSQIKISVGASIGLAQWTPGQTLPELIAAADSAMYGEKALAHSQKA